MTEALTAWALQVAPLPSSRQVGADRVGRVLIALVTYANADGIAWPSHATLSRTLGGMSVHDVRNALGVLADARLIVPAEEVRAGRTTRWVFPAARAYLAENLAGIPARSGEWARSNLVGNLAGNLAGDLAGDLAGIPATSREEKRTDITHNTALPRRKMTDAQRRNVLDALQAVDARCDSIDVSGYRDAEVALLDGLAPREREERIRTWAGLRSRALTDAGDDLVEDERLHALLTDHGFVWRGPSWPTRIPGTTTAWTDHREESA
ncbi:hypothetical protein [Microbacterium sp.]|uniref:hypothetical protein n=1 Tax=Microbacterium sp. TaxID=51671 RepID=UPI0039E5C9D0